MTVPVTEQFYSKTKVDELLAGLSSGGGGGGGGPLGISFVKTPTTTQVPNWSNEFMIANFDEWDEQSVTGDLLGITSETGSMGFAYAEAGWYQIQFKFWLGFTAVTTPLPDNVLFEWYSYEGTDLAIEIPCSPAPTISSLYNRSLHGCEFAVTTAPYWSPGVDEASAIDGANTTDLKWIGDATLSNGNSGPTNPLTMYITRLA